MYVAHCNCIAFIGAMPTDPKSLRLSLLTDEELMNLEGEERKNVEARIAVLRNIQLLLDSAVAQVNQYYVVTGRLAHHVIPSALVLY